MDKIFQSPSKYIQGKGVITRLSQYSKEFGERVLIITSRGGLGRFAAILDENEKNAENSVFFRESFGGECCMTEITRLKDLALEKKCDVIVGLGGGKVLDTAKAAAYFAGLPVIIAPTNAASDAPCSAVSVIYKEDGSFECLFHLKKNPDLVLVDSEIIATAPVRLLSAGIGDALATYFEMKACVDTDSANFVGGQVPLAAAAIAERCYDTLMTDGRKAYSAVAKGLCTRAVENVIEANILLSGIGFESGGVCGAHPINVGISSVPAAKDNLHGEYVAFGLLVQLVLNNEDEDLIYDVLEFLTDVELPVCLADLGIGNITEEQLTQAAAIADEDPSLHYLPKKAGIPEIKAAILAADALGREFKEAEEET